jgi:elongation factor Ts
MAISAEVVRALREKTGLPMMECKKALEEAGGNAEQAELILRKKGMAQASKRADRDTGHGRLSFHAAANKIALVELLCETEPVAGTADFIQLGKLAAEVAVGLDNPTADAVLQKPAPGHPGRTIQDLLHDVVNRIRENIKIGRVAVYAGHVGSYLHHDNRKGVLVEFSEACPAEVAADVCMHIAAMRPQYTKREDVDKALVEQEKSIAASQVQGKPPQIVDKIITGKLDRWYSEIVLLEQPFVKDDKKSVGQHLRQFGAGLTVKRYLRVAIGEA